MTKLRNQFLILTMFLVVLLLLLLLQTYATVPSPSVLLYPPDNVNFQLKEENVTLFYSGIILGFGLNMVIMTMIIFFSNKKVKVNVKDQEMLEQKRAHILGKIDKLTERYEKTEKATRVRKPRNRSENLMLSEKSR